MITPFTLAGAMAPVTMPGALVLQHAEALAGIVLSQSVRPGAPVVYGSFTSNVDMKSGSPAFGTPEFVQAAFGAGQLARHIGLPWRGSAATASNAPDEQSVYEYLMSAWGSILGGVNMMVHAAGWLEGGLTGSMEKFILDIEMLQTFAEIFEPLATAAMQRWLMTPSRRSNPAAIFSAANTPWKDTRPRSTNRWSQTGAISASGVTTAASAQPSAPTVSGNRFCRISKHRRWIRLAARSYRRLLSAAVQRAEQQ